ncbi:MAG: ABC transporter ATP-binding protein [Parvibaculum sp.]
MTSDPSAGGEAGDGAGFGAPPLLSLSNISKSYGDGPAAVSSINVDIKAGSFVSLVGPSGCGKSTLLRLVAGLLDPSQGTMTWPQSGQQPELGFVFQDATLLPWANSFDNVYLPLKLMGTSREEARSRVTAALSRVGLENDQDKRPHELSGGMRMRVSIARALVTEAPVLLMDEPFAALDEYTRELLDDDLLTLWQEFKWTVLFVTHSVYESVYLSERILVMGTGSGSGRIQADLAIDAPYPRGYEFRQSKTYFDHCRKVSAALRGEMPS